MTQGRPEGDPVGGAPGPAAAGQPSVRSATTEQTGGAHAAEMPAGPYAEGAPETGRSLSSVGDLVADISENLSTLIRQETALAKAEVRESASRGGKGAGLLGGAGVAGHFVLLFLSIALWWGIGEAIGRTWSALIVAAIWAVIAGVLAALGRKKLNEVQGMPQTVDTAKHIPDALKGNEEAR